MYRVLICPLILSVLTASASEKGDCSWVIDLVKKDQMQQAIPTLLPGGKYFIRIRIQCDGKIDTEMLRSLVLTGVTPLVHVESKYFDVDQYHSAGTIHQLVAALVEMGNHSCGGEKDNSNIQYYSGEYLCGQTHSTCFQPRGSKPEDNLGCCDCSAAACTSGSFVFCAPAWLVPLPLSQRALSINVQVVDTGAGPYIRPAGCTFHVDGFYSVTNGVATHVLGQDAHQLVTVQGAAGVNCQLSLTPACVYGGPHMSDFILYSSSEFASIKVLKVSELSKSVSVCSQQLSSDVIKGTLSLPDRVLINTPSGVYEVQSNIRGNPEYTGSRLSVLPRCVSGLAGPLQSQVLSVVVLALGDAPDHERVFVATLEQDQPLNFTELRDTHDRNACQFLRAALQEEGGWSCRVVSGSISSSSPVLFVILVHAQGADSAGFHLLQFSEAAGPGWVKLQSSFSVASALSRPLTLSGISFVAAVTKSLFLWGSALLYSPDGGTSVHWLTGYDGESTITVFTSSSRDGSYAFLTELQELWIGQIGSPSLRRLNDNSGVWPLTQNTVLAVFFDSQGKLQQLVAQNSSVAGTDCVSRVQVPAADIVAQQTFLRKRKENLQASLGAPDNSSCDLQSPEPKLLTERTCPFSTIRFQAPHGITVHRKCEHRFEPSVFMDGSLIQSKSSVFNYFALVERTVNQECGGDTKTSSGVTEENKLPKQIYLGRSEIYRFALYLYLDLDYLVDTSWHAWSLDHLHVALHLSDARLLNFSAQRTELVQQKAVKYEIVVQDAGKQFRQHPPGERSIPASLHLQVWNSALSCTASSINGELFEGSHILTFLLGCPAGRKVVFDADASKAASGKSQFCSDEQGVPCFLFERTFLPVFMLVDLVAGQISQFTGNYTLKVVGGGADLSSIRYYTQEEQETYNYRTSGSSASLVWAAKEKSLGTRPVFNSSTNAISWLCGSRSACGDISPKFPHNAEYYLKLEFSNREVGTRTSNCEFTSRFIIRVHGLPPGSLHPSSIIVLSCIGILAAVILCLFALKRKDARLLKLFKRLGSTFCGHVSRKVDVARVRVRRWKNRKTGTDDVELVQIRKTAPSVPCDAIQIGDNEVDDHKRTSDLTQFPTHA